MTKLGIIPAAGKAVRFGGLFKELMPIGDGETLLSHAVETLAAVPVDMTLVITNHYKIGAHSMALANHQVKFALQRDFERDAWGAIQASFDMAADYNYYLMPDTMIKADIPPITSDFTLGVFETYKPERFGVIDNGHIVDKNTTFAGLHQAWGMLIWSWTVVDFWKDGDYKTHTDAFNAAINEFGYGTFKIDKYHDIASFEDYRGLLCSSHI